MFSLLASDLAKVDRASVRPADGSRMTSVAGGYLSVACMTASYRGSQTHDIAKILFAWGDGEEWAILCVV